jgi:hypothetical protein
MLNENKTKSMKLKTYVFSNPSKGKRYIGFAEIDKIWVLVDVNDCKGKVIVHVHCIFPKQI